MGSHLEGDVRIANSSGTPRLCTTLLLASTWAKAVRQTTPFAALVILPIVRIGKRHVIERPFGFRLFTFPSRHCWSWSRRTYAFPPAALAGCGIHRPREAISGRG